MHSEPTVGLISQYLHFAFLNVEMSVNLEANHGGTTKVLQNLVLLIHYRYIQSNAVA